jgi:Putative prokaryotic signal transducing protein
MESHYTQIYTGNFIIVQLITSKLKDIGIEPIIKDESESGRLAGFSSSIQGQQEVYVHENELEKAIPIIESVKSEMEA